MGHSTFPAMNSRVAWFPAGGPLPNVHHVTSWTLAPCGKKGKGGKGREFTNILTQVHNTFPARNSRVAWFPAGGPLPSVHHVTSWTLAPCGKKGAKPVEG